MTASDRPTVLQALLGRPAAPALLIGTLAVLAATLPAGQGVLPWVVLALAAGYAISGSV
ncbi:hypothetical protein [Serinicoccus kebangsaanensis]|uniref:hypothetical protein n=1 Tax=Serinicoccus kebangsaanensis TaxID=2602069 RepID=UPI00178C71B4|nr:hypothetical protein [Serinicoccus kebangsaanensis]